jgi:carbon monoxide dehydrogenase subunit G
MRRIAISGARIRSAKERMMSQLETVVEIERSIEQVFAYLADLRNMTAWAEGIVEVEAMTPGTTGPGTSYRLVGLLAGCRLATPIAITQYEPGRSYTSVTRMGPLVFDDHWEFTPSGDGTRVQQMSDIHAAGLWAPLGWLAARLLGKRLAEDLRRAKRLLEATS